MYLKVEKNNTSNIILWNYFAYYFLMFLTCVLFLWNNNYFMLKQIFWMSAYNYVLYVDVKVFLNFNTSFKSWSVLRVLNENIFLNLGAWPFKNRFNLLLKIYFNQDSELLMRLEFPRSSKKNTIRSFSRFLYLMENGSKRDFSDIFLWCNNRVDRFTQPLEKVVQAAKGRPVPLQKYGRLII